VTGAQLARKDLPALPLHPGEGIVNSDYYPSGTAYGDGEQFSLLWLEPLAAVMTITLAGILLLVRRRPVMTTGPWLCMWLLIGVALCTLSSLLARYNSQLSIHAGYLVFYSWGFWAILLGMFVVVVGVSAVRLWWAGKPLTDRENGQVPHSASDKQGRKTCMSADMVNAVPPRETQDAEPGYDTCQGEQRGQSGR